MSASPMPRSCKHAFLPAILTYGALFYVVDLEAVKAGMTGLPRAKQQRRWQATLIKAALTICIASSS